MYDTYGIPLGCGCVKKSTLLRSRVDLYKLKILFVFSAVYLTGGTSVWLEVFICSRPTALLVKELLSARRLTNNYADDLFRMLACAMPTSFILVKMKREFSLRSQYIFPLPFSWLSFPAPPCDDHLSSGFFLR